MSRREAIGVALLAILLMGGKKAPRTELVLSVTPRFSASPVAPLVTIKLKHPVEALYCPRVIYRILNPTDARDDVYHEERESDCAPWAEWVAEMGGAPPEELVWSWSPRAKLGALPEPLEWAIQVRVEQGKVALTEAVYVRVVGG